jgi:ABC-type transport system involved in cytochrome c biogenesis permease subunit
MVTRWKLPWRLTMGLLLVALALHAYGVGLRWYIVGHVPLASMFEAIVGSAALAIAGVMVIELFYKTRIFLVGASAAGFMALVVAGYVLPATGLSSTDLTAMMGILDHIQLRIHTVLITGSYALIFVAAIIAAVYLYGHYLRANPLWVIEAGASVAGAGTALWLVPLASAQGVFGILGGAVLSVVLTSSVYLALLAALVLPTCALTRGFAIVKDKLLDVRIVAIVGVLWVVSRAVAALWPAEFTPLPTVGKYTVPVGILGIALPGAIALLVRLLRQENGTAPQGSPEIDGGGSALRPILAGAAPGDEQRGDAVPQWLNDLDWSHLIILNLVFVMLFVGGVIMGAMWADQSWGRPWGWDPKEVFALNTWIIYAILLHIRHIVRNRGLWTAWLSVAGCAMMAFNWFFVNYYISSIHSYA